MGFKLSKDEKGRVAAEAIQIWCKRNGFTVPLTEHRFAPPRRWKFDLAWPEDKVAIEIQGGGWTQGGHTRGAGFEDDCEKFSHAAILGWRLLLVTYDQINAGLLYQWIDKIFPPEIESMKSTADLLASIGAAPIASNVQAQSELQSNVPVIPIADEKAFYVIFETHGKSPMIGFACLETESEAVEYAREKDAKKDSVMAVIEGRSLQWRKE